MILPLEELLNAPLLPSNLPRFEIIKECKKVRDNDSESDMSSEEESDFEDIEEVFPCECKYDENSVNFESQACGPSANCINRELFIECDGEECPCRERCQNQRFHKRQYAEVKVIETPGKGFGLFICEDLKAGSLVMEYVGEVVNQEQMARRAELYASQKQPHFYFMTLRPNQIIDATCCGNLSRFMNHSCVPNCETQKWIVDGRIRIGLFTLKSVKAGQELTFDYKFVRFGKEPQKCLCGEAVCTGFIGVSETEKKVKSSRKGSKKQAVALSLFTSEDEAEEFESFMESGPTCANSPAEVSILVSKLIKTDNDVELIKKILSILEGTFGNLCQRKFLSLHGLKLLGTIYQEHCKDSALIESILTILSNLTLTSRNAIEESNWFEKLKSIQTTKEFLTCEEILKKCRVLEEKWSSLEKVFRIPRKIEDEIGNEDKQPFNDLSANNPASVLMSVPSEFSSALKRKRQWNQDSHREDDRRSRSNNDTPPNYSTTESKSRSRSPTKSLKPDRQWLPAKAPDGRTYYYHSQTRETSWEQPMVEEVQRIENERDNDQRSSRPYYCRNDDHLDHRDNRRHDTMRNDRRDHNRDYNIHTDQRESKSIPRTDHRESNSKTDSQYIEGVQDSKELAAIIERAKARRIAASQHGELGERVDDKYKQELSSPPVQSNHNSRHSKVKEEISNVVIRFFSHYRNELGDEFKELARKYTHKIIDKELKELKDSDSPDSATFQLTSKKKLKIKNYLAEVIKAKNIKLIPEHEI